MSKRTHNCKRISFAVSTFVIVEEMNSEIAIRQLFCWIRDTKNLIKSGFIFLCLSSILLWLSNMTTRQQATSNSFHWAAHSTKGYSQLWRSISISYLNPSGFSHCSLIFLQNQYKDLKCFALEHSVCKTKYLRSLYNNSIG